MAGVNKVILVGNLGADPEVRTLENGVKVARIRIATSESYTNREGVKVDQTEWHSVTLWRGLAEITEKYLSKGRQVYIEGKLQTRSWKGEDGNDRYATEIVANTMQMLGRGTNEGQGGMAANPAPQAAPAAQPQQAQPTPQAAPSAPTAEDDDLPF